MQWNEFSYRIRHFEAADRQMLQKAFEIGAKAHGTQLRQSGEPYFSHPIAVASMLVDLHADADTLAAALLHDTVEDTELTLADIEREFNPVIASLVDGVTKLNTEDIIEFPKMNEQVESLRKMFVLMQEDVRIMVIKLVDRLHNMLTIGFQKPAKQQTVAKETLDVYVKIADRLCMRDMRDMLEELSRAILEPEIHTRVLEVRKRNEVRCLQEIKYIQKNLKESFGKQSITMEYERKSWNKERMQYELEGEAISGISGINIAIICKDVTACYEMLGLLHQLWQREIMSFEDFINAPVINGYKGLHTTIILEDGMRVRCKLRTKEMDDYARRGVTLFCFDRNVKGVLDYLPWVEHISPLSEDTKQRSSRFWQSLQNDVLGESIIIHGPSDQVSLAPKESTVLDALFYLFGKDALKTTSATVNGKSASFYDDVSNAVTVTAAFASESQANIEWLQNVRTGIASAMIRQELVKMPTQDREAVGERLLDEAVARHGQVRLEELSASTVRSILRNFNMASMSNLYNEIAIGKLNPDDVARGIFKENQDESMSSEWSLNIKYVLPDEGRVEKVVRMFPFHKVNYKVKAGGHVTFHAKYQLTAPQLYRLQNALGTVLKKNQWSLTHGWGKQSITFLMILLVILWGLDPVFARSLLKGNVDAADLTVIRFITFFVAASAMYGWQTIASRQRLKPLSPFQPSLIMSGVALFITGSFTYYTLTHLSASQYILYIISGLMLANTAKSIMEKRERTPLTLSSMALAFSVVAITLYQGISATGILAAVASSLGFILYSEVSKRYQQEITTIQGRYPAFLFWVSAVCLILSLATAPLLGFTLPDSQTLFRSVLFAVVFAVVPYVLYFESMRRSESKFLDNSLPFVFISTIIGEVVATKSFDVFLLIPAVLICMFLYAGRKEIMP